MAGRVEMMRKTWDVFCFGTTNCDILFGGLPNMPRLGTEEYCREFKIQAGGAANTAMALARLGLKVGFYTRLGDDPLGHVALESLRWAGVDLERVEVAPSVRTSVSAVLSCRADRGIATFDQTAVSAVPLDVLESCLARSKWIHTHLDYMRALPIGAMARQCDTKISLDVSYHAGMRMEDYAEALQAADAFMPNLQEACMLADCEDGRTAAVRLNRLCPLVVVKAGPEGCWVAQDGRAMHVKTVPETCVDTCGAGDLFCAGFLRALLAGKDVRGCAEFGNAAGGLSVTFLGGMDERFSLEGVREYQEKHRC